MRHVFLLAASIVSGGIGGMGIGGGIVLIPVLTTFFGIGQKDAQFVNLIYFVPVALSALWVHMRAGRVEWKKVIYMALGGVAGAFLGSALAGVIKTGLLKRLFGLFLFAVGIDQLKKPKKAKMEE